MAVRIRMKQMGRKHRPFYRICAIDSRRPRDGRVIEELGSYDPLVPDTDARAILNTQRVQYWLSVGALPSDKVRVLIEKYGAGGTHVAQQEAARARLAAPKVVPDAGKPAYIPAAPGEAASAAQAPAASEPAVEAAVGE